MRAKAKTSTFELILIKPTHYDDDGYPITWLQSHIPSNTLAALYGLGEDCRRRGVLGPDVDIVRSSRWTRPISRIRPDRIVADIRRSGGKALICLVGVQSNQFPRAVDLARQFLKAGLPVALGGFHVVGLPVDAAGRSRRRSSKPWTWASRSSAAKPRRAGSTSCCSMPGTAR